MEKTVRDRTELNTKGPTMKKKILLTAGLFIQDRPERWDFVLNLWEQLANTFKQLNVDARVFCHPCLYDNRSSSHTGSCGTEDYLEMILDPFKPDYIFLWNGESPGDKIVIEMAKKYNVKVIYAELGWFPQAGHIYFDTMGTNAQSSFTKMKFKKLTEAQDQELQYLQDRFGTGGLPPNKPTKRHLIILQDEKDTNMINSRFNSMSEFVMEAVEYIESNYKDATVAIRPHPHQVEVASQLVNESCIDKTPLYHSIRNSCRVHAINSTVLLEAAMLRVSIRPYDDGIIRRDLKPWEIKPLLYQLAERQLCWEALVILNIIKNYPVFAPLWKRRKPKYRALKRKNL